ncbi:hypothetical protein Aduo_019009 [Ancylostoma duodenale]
MSNSEKLILSLSLKELEVAHFGHSQVFPHSVDPFLYGYSDRIAPKGQESGNQHIPTPSFAQLVAYRMVFLMEISLGQRVLKANATCAKKMMLTHSVMALTFRRALDLVTIW